MDVIFTGKVISIVIPDGRNHFYSITLVSDKNEKTDLNFAMMLQCVKLFRFTK